MVSLVKGYVSKAEGAVNTPYGANLLDLFLALAASGYEKAFKFVSRNLCGVLLHHMQSLNQKQRTETFTNIDQHEIVTRLGKKIASIRHIINEDGSCVAFTADIDGTVIVKLYQVPFSHGVVVGGAYPNHYLSINEVKVEGLKLFFRNSWMDYMGNLRQRLMFSLSSSRITHKGCAHTLPSLVNLKP